MQPDPKKPFRPPKEEDKNPAPKINEERVKRLSFRELLRKIVKE